MLSHTSLVSLEPHYYALGENSIEKTAGILDRLARGATGSLKGMLLGGLGGVGLGMATGGIAPMLAIGSGAAIGGLAGLKSGLLSSIAKATPEIATAAKNVGHAAHGIPHSTAANLQRYIDGLAPAVPLALGGGLGYMLADDDSKMLGAGLGMGAGFLGRRLLM